MPNRLIGLDQTTEADSRLKKPLRCKRNPPQLQITMTRQTTTTAATTAETLTSSGSDRGTGKATELESVYSLHVQQWTDGQKHYISNNCIYKLSKQEGRI